MFCNLKSVNLDANFAHLSDCDLGSFNNAAVFGYRWVYGQLDDRVEFVRDLPANGTGQAPANSRRAQLLNKIRPFQCNHDGTGVEFLQDDVRLKRDGSLSDLTDPGKLQLAHIPRFWTISYLGVDGYMYRLFSEHPRTGWLMVEPFGYPRYRGKADNGKLLSYSGVYPTASISLITSDAYARATNPSGRVTPLYLYNPMYWLQVLDTGRFNMQAYYTGITNAGSAYSSAAMTGLLDVLTAPSGQIVHEYTAGSFTYPFRWRFIEQFFGQIWNILSGIYVRWEPGWELQKVYMAESADIITTNNDYSNYKLIGEIDRNNGYVKEFIPDTILPAEKGASTTTGKCDYNYNSTSQSTYTNTALVGGTSIYGGYAGPGYLNSDWLAGYAAASVGASFVLTELPEAAAQPPG